MPNNNYTITNLLILVSLAVFGLQHLLGSQVSDWLGLWPIQASPYGEGSLFWPWQVVTYGFVYQGWLQLLFILLGLYTIGEPIERLLGHRRYLLYFLACSVAAALTYLIVASVADLPYRSMDSAAGGLLGVLLAFGVVYPRQKLQLMLLPIQIPGWLFVILYGAGELYVGVTQTLHGIAHFTLLGGMLVGLVLMRFWRAPITLKA